MTTARLPVPSPTTKSANARNEITAGRSCLDGSPRRSPPGLQTVFKLFLLGTMRLVPLGGVGVRIIRAVWRRATTPERERLARGVQVLVVAALGWVNAILVVWISVRTTLSFCLGLFGINMTPPAFPDILPLLAGGFIVLSVVDVFSIDLDVDCPLPESAGRRPDSDTPSLWPSKRRSSVSASGGRASTGQMGATLSLSSVGDNYE